MSDYNELLPRKTNLMDSIRSFFRTLTGYREGRRFLIDSDPIMKDYSEIELMNLANIEEKLSGVLKENKNSGKIVEGIKESEAEELLQYVVQNARNEFQKTMDNTPIEEKSLLGYCGFGQGVTGYTLINMGLSPNVCNIGSIVDKNSVRHAFLTVSIPVKEGKKAFEKEYLVDTTYRQFFERDGRFGIATEDQKENYIIKDKRFGNRVYPNEGYWAIKQKGGEEFSKEILSKGFIELTEKNAKIYGDSFVLSVKPREDYTKVPKKYELETNNSGKYYIDRIHSEELQEYLDYDPEELEYCTKTPLMKKKEKVQVINKEELSTEKSMINNKENDKSDEKNKDNEKQKNKNDEKQNNNGNDKEENIADIEEREI